MCYACSPGCDNCYPKMLECPRCGHVELLAREECSKCGCPITAEMREAAEEEWKLGRRFANASKQKRNLVVERMMAQGQGCLPRPPG